MASPFLGEIRIASFGFAPKGWAQCNGQLLPINQNQALFSILGTTYGGTGVTDFALPNLQGRVPMHFGNGFTQGEMAGEESHTLTLPEAPLHGHQVTGSSTTANSPSPVGNYLAASGNNNFNPATDTTLSGASVTASGGGGAHENRSPFLALNFVIALQGIFPTRS